MLKVPLDGSALALERLDPCLEKSSRVLPSIGSLERDLRVRANALRPPMGQKRRFDPMLPTSGLPRISDMVRQPRHVSKVPKNDIDHRWRLSQRGS